MFWKRLIVADQERLLVAKNGRFQAIFASGKYRIFVQPGVSLELERHDVRDLVFQSMWADYLVKERPDVIASHFTLVETNDVQIGMVYVDGELFQVLTPAKRVLFWRGRARVTAEMVALIADCDSLATFSALEEELEV